MAEGELVSLPGRGVVAETGLCGAGRGRRDRAASCCRADHGGRAEGAAVGAPSRLGRCVACLDFAGARALADWGSPETHDEVTAWIRRIATSDLHCETDEHGMHVKYGSLASVWRKVRESAPPSQTDIDPVVDVAISGRPAVIVSSAATFPTSRPHSICRPGLITQLQVTRPSALAILARSFRAHRAE